MRIVTDRLILREVQPSDAKSIVKQINNLNISKWLLVVPHPYTMKDAKWWINHCREKRDQKPRGTYDFAIELKGHPGSIGGIGLGSIDRKEKTGSLGYWLGEDHWRQGYMGEAANKVLSYGFNKLNLKRIQIPAFLTNIPSNSLAQKLGGKFIERKGLHTCKATGKKHMENVYWITPSSWKRSLRK